MAKVVKGALKVVGAVASVLAVIPSPIQPIAAAVATVSAIASTALEVVAPTKPRSSVNGSQTQFKLDPNAGIPYCIGRTFYAGSIVHRDTWGKDNQYQGMALEYSSNISNSCPIASRSRLTARATQMAASATLCT